LDIFGFEDFAVNSFEQVCINLANEQLQHFFNAHVFELELEEYTREGISGANISYVDNKPLLEFFLAKPVGLLAILDEETIMPRATDSTFVDKLKKTYVNNKYFSCGKSNDANFTVAHYAGRVTYEGVGFLEKNKDYLAPDIVQLLQDSGMLLVSNMFLSSPDAAGALLPVINRRDTIGTKSDKLQAAKVRVAARCGVCARSTGGKKSNLAGDGTDGGWRQQASHHHWHAVFHIAQAAD
jgi:myosin III